MSRKIQKVLCLSNKGYELSLNVREIYNSFEDKDAEEVEMIRVVDNSGADYLFPKELFYIPKKEIGSKETNDELYSLLNDIFEYVNSNEISDFIDNRKKIIELLNKIDED